MFETRHIFDLDCCGMHQTLKSMQVLLCSEAYKFKVKVLILVPIRTSGYSRS